MKKFIDVVNRSPSPKATSFKVDLSKGNEISLCGSKKKMLTHAEFHEEKLQKAIEAKEQRLIEKSLHNSAIQSIN